MKIKTTIIGLIITPALLYLAGCSENNAKVSLDSAPVYIEVEEARYSNGNSNIAYSGIIEESEKIPLSFTGVGSVSKVLVSEGEHIRKGQLLAVLDNATYKNAYEMALAIEKRAQDAYNRLLPMYKNGNLPEIKFIEVETALQQAKSSAAISKKSLDDCNLYSPTDGIVGKRSIEPGMTAMPNITSITIVKINKVFANVSIPEQEISAIKKGDKAQIKIAALGNPEFQGSVEEIGVIADPIGHSYKIKIGISNKDNSIKPGMICKVYMQNKKSSSKLFVSSEAVSIDENGKAYVFVISQDKRNALIKKVKTGSLLNNGIEIIDGLNAGDLVVINGQQKLTDNSYVKILNK